MCLAGGDDPGKPSECGAVGKCGESGPKPGHTIKFEGTPAQKAKFERWLNEIRKTPSGKKLLEDIDKSGKSVTLKHDAASRATSGETIPGTKTPANWAAATDGTGVDTTIVMDTTIPDHGSSWVFDSSGNKIEFTAPQNLFHELAHAKHTTNGTLDMTDPEGQVIGMENKFRKDEKATAPERKGHAGVPRT